MLIHNQDVALLCGVRYTTAGNVGHSILLAAGREYRLVYPTDRDAATSHSGQKRRFVFAADASPRSSHSDQWDQSGAL